MHTSLGYIGVFVVHVIVMLIRVAFDIPKFLFFLIHGQVRPESKQRGILEDAR